MQRKFIINAFLFFMPVLVGYGVLEYYTQKIPLNYTHIQQYLEDEASSMKVLILGSSQLNNAINPAFLEMKTLNLASSGQHHDTDFRLLKQMTPKLPNLKTVVLEVSYNHFEWPHNGKKFWKNHIFYTYYNVNTFERPTYFKDGLIYLSNPRFYYEKLRQYYGHTGYFKDFNKYGYDTLKFDGLFQDLKYDPNAIAQVEKFKINRKPDLAIFKSNTAVFFEMLDYLEKKNMRVILCEAPMYKSFLYQRNPIILRRKDSILNLAEQKYKNVTSVRFETDTIQFKERDFFDHNHLNSQGGKKFSEKLNEILLRHSTN